MPGYPYHPSPMRMPSSSYASAHFLLLVYILMSAMSWVSPHDNVQGLVAALPGAHRQLEAGACGAPAKADRDEPEAQAAVQDPSLPDDPGAWEEVGGPAL